MKKVNNTKVPDVIKQARQVLGMPYLKDKIICFVSSWERSRIAPYVPIEDDEKEYVLKELALFETAKNWWQKEADFSFIAFRQFENNSDIDFEEKTMVCLADANLAMI